MWRNIGVNMILNTFHKSFNSQPTGDDFCHLLVSFDTDQAWIKVGSNPCPKLIDTDCIPESFGGKNDFE